MVFGVDQKFQCPEKLAGVALCEMKIARAKQRGVEVTVCLSGRLLSTHTHTLPGGKHSRDSALIMFHFYQELQMCTLYPFAFPSTSHTENEDKHQVVQ